MNTKKGHAVKFNLQNYSKGDSMFNYGMKIAIYSDRKVKDIGVGWHKGGTDIGYFKNNIRRDFNFTKYFYTLTYTHTFEYDDDAVFFSYSVPYTLTDLRNDLHIIEADPVRSKFIQFTTLCKTISGVNVPLLSISSQKKGDEKDKKPCVVLTAR